jgi:hypothetical protein
MAYGGDWMAKKHSWSGIAHHVSYFLAHGRLVAVDGAFCAHGLCLPKLAACYPFERILP